MNFLSLEYFIAVAECGSIREAAKQLYITEQSLSERIKKLEKEMGVKLINRTRPQTLTAEGRFLLTGAKEILAIHAKIQRQIARAKAAQPEQVVRVWASSAIGVPHFLPDMVTAFHQKHPNYRAEIIMSLEDRDFSQADLYFLPFFDERPKETVVLQKDRMCVMVSDTQLEQSFGDEKEAVLRRFEAGDLSLLFRRVPFLEPIEEGNCHLSRMGEDAGRAARLSLSDSRAVDFSLCIKGTGALVGPESDFRGKLEQEAPGAMDRMHLYPIPNLPQMEITLNYPPGHSLTPAEQAFVQVAKDHFKN